ncbi:MAG: ATP-binding protein [Microthrixaceae bacterium]
MLGTEDTATTGDGDRTVAAPIGGPITLGFPARPEPVRLARLVSAAVAGSVDATIDDIEDLRIAVGEACAILVGHASPTGRVDITIEAGPDAIGFQCGPRRRHPTRPPGGRPGTDGVGVAGRRRRAASGRCGRPAELPVAGRLGGAVGAGGG